MHRSSACALALVIASGCAPRLPPPYAGFVDEPVAAVASQLAGQVVSIPVREGDRVRKGDLLAQLEARDREAAVTQAEANVDRATQSLREAEANLRAALPSVTGAGADIARAQATLDEATIELSRVDRLVATDAISRAELDSARARMLEAEAARDSLIAMKAQTQGRAAAASAGVSDARAALRSSEAALELARVQLAQTRITSPFDGFVVARNMEEGEWAAPGSAVVTVEDAAHPWVRLDVEETEFAALRLGAPADVHVIALGSRTLRGHVTQIGAEGDFATNRDVKRGRPDVTTFLVRVSFEEQPDGLRPGMTAEVRILPTTRAAPGGSSEAKR